MSTWYKAAGSTIAPVSVTHETWEGVEVLRQGWRVVQYWQKGTERTAPYFRTEDDARAWLVERLQAEHKRLQERMRVVTGHLMNV